MPTPFAEQTLANLRDGSNFSWYIIPILVIIMYIYSNEIQKALKTGNWNIVSAGLALFGMDLLNEIINGLIFHFTDYAALWMTPGDSVYVIMIGWNIEIAFMFSIAGITFAKTLPEDKSMKILGIPNRWALAMGFSAFAVFIEVFLNKVDALVWTYSFWTASITGIWLIFLFGYLHFFVVAFIVHDKPNKCKIRILAIIYTLGIGSVIVFMGILDWI